MALWVAGSSLSALPAASSADAPWSLAAIEATRRVTAPEARLQPALDRNTLDHIIVIEDGGASAMLIDGTRLAPVTRFALPHQPDGLPELSPDGRRLYVAGRDGWVSLFELGGAELIAELRVGETTHGIAVSGDGAAVAVAATVAGGQPGALVILAARDLAPLKVIAARDMRGDAATHIAEIQAAPTRESFVVALGDLRELWEVSTAAVAPPRFGGLAHTNERGAEEVVLPTGGFPIRRIELKSPIAEFRLLPGERLLLGAASARYGMTILHLDVGREIATLAGAARAEPAIVAAWQTADGTRLALPLADRAGVSIVDAASWTTVQTIDTSAPVTRLRTHPLAPHLWAIMRSPDGDRRAIIDKVSLKTVATTRLAPGLRIADLAFTRGGRHVVMTTHDGGGAVLIVDVATQALVVSIPAVRPSSVVTVGEAALASGSRR